MLFRSRDKKVSKICLALMAKDDPLSVKPVTCAAEKTITLPKNIIPSDVAIKV